MHVTVETEARRGVAAENLPAVFRVAVDAPSVGLPNYADVKAAIERSIARRTRARVGAARCVGTRYGRNLYEVDLCDRTGRAVGSLVYLR